MPLAAMREREQSENSTPDDLTHNEMCVLYRESADSIRFASYSSGARWARPLWHSLR